MKNLPKTMMAVAIITVFTTFVGCGKTQQEAVEATNEQEAVEATTEQEAVEADTQQEAVEATNEQEVVEADTQEEPVEATTEQVIEAATEQEAPPEDADFAYVYKDGYTILVYQEEGYSLLVVPDGSKNNLDTNIPQELVGKTVYEGKIPSEGEEWIFEWVEPMRELHDIGFF